MTGDGKVNVVDLVRLKRYIARENVTVYANPDVTGDGKVNVVDLVRLKRYIAREPVEIH